MQEGPPSLPGLQALRAAAASEMGSPLRLSAALLAATALLLPCANANSFIPPVQLHNCSIHPPSTQLWQRVANGSLFTLDARGGTGYCLKISPGSNPPKVGTMVYSGNCGGTTTSNNGGTTGAPAPIFDRGGVSFAEDWIVMACSAADGR